MPYQPIDYGTDYYPSGDELTGLRSTSSTYSNSNLTVGQERQRQLENAGLARGVEGKALDPQRILNSDTSRLRMSMPKTGSFLSKAAGLEQFKSPSNQPDATQSAKPVQATSNLPLWADDVARQKEFNKLALERSQGLSAGELQANINRVKQYEPLANNEANRALGMDLATKFPYHKYDTEADAFKSVTNNMLSPSRFASLASTQIKPMQYVSF